VILIVESNEAERDALAEQLGCRGYEVLSASTVQQARGVLAAAPCDLVLANKRIDPDDAVELGRAVRSGIDTPLILYGDSAEPELFPAISECLASSDRAPRKLRGVDRLVGASPAMEQVRTAIRRLAPLGTTVLIHGETGTGKELVARALHEESDRKRFVTVSVPELSEGVLESELFGHRRGAFTGAVASRPGLFESAAGGTLFLDEIGDTPIAVQVKLLRALETREIRPVGGSTTRPVDVRIVAATHCNLPELIRWGRFREDLFYRLRGATIHLPALRERAEDIEAIAQVLIDDIAATARLPIPKLDPSLVAALRRCAWKGNVRELRAVLENALVWREGDGPLEHSHLMQALISLNPALGSEDGLLAQRMFDAYRRHRWNQEAARRELGFTRAEWRCRFARLGLDALRRQRRRSLRPAPLAS
jgi:DNA-binding NtrC family response regulator